MSDVISNISGQIPQVTATRATSTAETDRRQESPVGGKDSPPVQEPKATPEQVEVAVANISDFVQSISRELQFQVDDSVGGTVITVVDRETGDVVRQIPQEEIIRLARHLSNTGEDAATGLLLNSDGLT